MKHLLQRTTLTLLVASIIFYSCKKERLCEQCPTDPPITNTNNTSTNKPPIAAAGPDQTVTLPDNIFLNGSASNDPDGGIPTWQWRNISGSSSFVIVNPNDIRTRVSDLRAGIHLFELQVTDNGGLSARDTVQITVLRPLFNPNGNNVYIAGWGKNASGKSVAKIWHNGLVQNLSDGQNDAVAYSVAVSGNDVYVAGYDGANAVLWKNGVAQNLGNGRARSVFASGSDVYIAGKSGTAATMWKNGLPQNLGNGEAISVFVSGNDVYVAGYAGGVTALWKNGLVQNLANTVSEGNEPTSVFASGNDVYMAGNSYFTFSFGFATIWKNGVEKFLGPRDGSASSLFISGSDVYVAGKMLGDWGDAAQATIWKNDEAISLTDGQYDAIAHSVFVSGSNVYATGGIYPNAGNESFLWINGLEYLIPGFTEANSVFVQ